MEITVHHDHCFVDFEFAPEGASGRDPGGSLAGVGEHPGGTGDARAGLGAR